jgi:uncharacterized protein YbcI
MAQQIAEAAIAFKQGRTTHDRKWVAVFMNEDTIVIALHGSLTAAEQNLAQSPTGAAWVREFHQQMFIDASGVLHRKIKSITGMKVRDTKTEIEPKTGHVVQVFTTDTVGEEFPVGRQLTGHQATDCSTSTREATYAKPTKPLDVQSRDNRPDFTKRISK